MARDAMAQLAALSKATKTVGNTAAAQGAVGLGGFTSAVSKMNAGLKAGLGTMERYGKNLQWTGRQLSFNFTVPLLLAGGAATKWALDNETAMTGVRKVYGDGTESAAQLNGELDALQKSFRLLSDRFGVNQAEVIGVAQNWAQAGSAGVGLAKSTQLTLEAMIIGSMDATKATEGLIAVQSVYRLSSDDTRKALELMNAVENATATDMSDLITSFQAAGGTARTAGVDVRHLAAMTAALVPAAGSASQAGNSLKTIISRVMAPTKQAADAMASIGIDINTVSWQSKTATERLEVLAKSFDGLHTSQKSVVASAIAGRRQQSRYIQLMTEMADANGFYARSLRVTSDQEKAHKTYQKELLTYLSSNPQKVKILTTSLKNFMADAIIPLLPTIIGLIKYIVSLAKSFSDLSPHTKQFIIFALAGLAILGPFIQMLGATVLLFSQLGHVVLWGGKLLQWIGKIFGLLSPVARTAARGRIASAKAATEAEVQAAETAAAAHVQAAETSAAAWTAAHAAMAGEAATSAEASVAAATVKAEASAAGATAAASAASATAAAEAAAATATAAAWMAAFEAMAAGSFTSMLAIEAGQVAVAAIGPGAMAEANIAAAGASTGAWYSAIDAELGAKVSAATKAAAINATAVEGEVVAAGATTGFWSSAWATISEGAAATWAFIAGAPLWAVVAAVAAVVVAILLIFNKDFRDGVINAIKAIGRVLWGLPEAFGRMLVALAHVVQRAIENIMDMLSYLNPFAHHSPSMVENVTAGIGVIIDQYARLGAIAPMLRAAAMAHNKFLAATAPVRANQMSAKRAEQRDTIREIAPAVLPAFNVEVAQIGILTAALGPLQDKIAAQQQVVDAWQASLDALSITLRDEQYELQLLGNQVDDLTKDLQSHKDALDKLMNTPIQGMNEMEDAIFANTMAQKKLQLQMLKMGDAGQGIDDVKNKLAALNGEIEKVTSERTDLRLAGAGSDVLGPLDAQLDALKQQKDVITQQGAEVNDLQAQLEALQHQADEMDLEKSITFDPQIRQLDILANRMQELPFDDILAGVTKEKNAITQIEPVLAGIQAQYDQQQAKVEGIQRQHDAVSHALDLQNDKLKQLQDSYSAIKDLIDQMESSLLDAVQATNDLKDAKDKASADASAMGDFQIPEATGTLGREGGLPDINKFNDDMQKQIDDMMKNMDTMDPFGGIKKKWDNFKNDFKRGLGVLGGWFTTAWHGIEKASGVAWDGIKKGADVAWNGIKVGASVAWNAIASAVSWVWNNVLKPIWDGIVWFVTNILAPVFSWLYNNIIKPVWDAISAAISWVWNSIIKPVFETLVNFFTSYVFPIWQLFFAVVNIVVTLIARVVQWLWEHVISNVFDWIMDGIHLLGTVFSWLYNNIIKPVWDAIGAAISWAWNNVIKPVWSAFTTVLGFLGQVLNWLWHNIIEPVMTGIGKAISWAWDHLIKPIWDAFSGAIVWVGNKLKDFWHKVVTPVMNGVRDVFKTVWNAIADGLESVINGFIKGFNLITGAIRSIGNFLHIKVSIDDMPELKIPHFALGGKLPESAVGSGFVTNGARAIVGEGSAAHPEYVVPTDPQFRQRALMLWRALGADLGAPGMASGGIIPQLGIGGVIGGIADVAGSIVGAVSDKARKAFADTLFAPIRPIVNGILDAIPVDMISGAGHKIFDAAYQFARGDKPTAFAAGGRFNVPHTPGGTNILVGEGSNNEQVQVLPYVPNGDGDGKTLNFYGDLSFPNITDPDDAEEFIKNLEGLTNG